MRYFHAWICHESHISTSGGTIFMYVWVKISLAESSWIYKYVPIKNDSCRFPNDSIDELWLCHFFHVWVICFLAESYISLSESYYFWRSHIVLWLSQFVFRRSQIWNALKHTLKNDSHQYKDESDGIWNDSARKKCLSCLFCGWVIFLGGWVIFFLGGVKIFDGGVIFFLAGTHITNWLVPRL